MTSNVNHILQGLLVALQGINIATIPINYAKWIMGVIAILQWYVSNFAAKSDPTTGDKLK